MGSPWKMFNKKQGQELIDHTNYTWTTIHRVNGMKFTSKTDSSKYIFLPAAGEWLVAEDMHGNEHSDLYNTDGGDYWSTILYDSQDAYSLRVYQGYDPVANMSINSNYRYYGRPVVAVK